MVNDQLSELQELVQFSRPIIKQAVAAACHKYLPKVDAATVEDLTGQIIVNLLEDDCRRLQSFQHHSQLKTWLYRVAVNQVINHAQRQKKTENLDDLPLKVIALSPCQEDEVYLHEEQKIINQELQAMSEKDQKLWVVLCNDDLDDHQRAAILDVEYQQFCKYKYRFINKLWRTIGRGGSYP